MTFSNTARRLRAGSAISTIALLAFVNSPALAQAPATQTVPPAPGEVSGQAATPAQVEDSSSKISDQGPDIVVTGSLFRNQVNTVSPLTTITQDTLQKAGITTINDAIRSVSADSAGSIPTGFQGGFSAGGAAVSLRGLGVSSTLVLIDGLRTANFPLNDDGHNAYVDLNSIPFATVEKVDVLREGASSTYGADALGGVVNIITRKHYNGLDGAIEGGEAGKGYAGRIRVNLTGGIGDYERQGFNFWAGAEYQHDGRASVQDIGFPFNTADLSTIGLAQNNTGITSLTASRDNGTVRRSTQTDINDPFTGGTASGTYTTLNLNCADGTFTVAGAAGGTACRSNATNEYSQVQPRQDRYSFSGRLSVRVSDDIEGYVSGSYTFNEVDILGAPAVARNRQPYGGAPTTSSLNVVLPYFVCAAGVNCFTAADKRLNPNNPYATDINATQATALANAARFYGYLPDIVGHSDRKNHVIRGTAGVRGSFGDGWNFNVDAVGAKDYLTYTSFSTVSIAGLRQAINTGAYNFVNPSSNSTAVRQLVAPINASKSNSSQAALDASISKDLFMLPSGKALSVAVGGQIRRETLTNNSQNPQLLNYANTAAAFGRHTVSAGYFEVQAPIFDQLLIVGGGRYDHYSEGFSHFSPKIKAVLTPVKMVSIRGGYSQGFRAPTFAESNPASSYPGFVTYQPPANFVAAHGGTANTFYTAPYSVGGGFSGNPNLKPEKSRELDLGATFQPVRWLSVGVDFYDVKKTDTIVAGPDAGKARAAYYSQTTLPAAIAAVAAIPGYSVSAVDAVDPLFPNALPRVLVINGPYVNAGFFKTQGIDVNAYLNIPVNEDLRIQSRLDVTKILKFNVDFGDGVIRKYAGTLGPYELSSGAGTPKWRGNWQNTITYKQFSLSATTYYVSRIKQVAADEEAPGANGQIDLSCATAAGDLYGYPTAASQSANCYIKKFIYADLNGTVRVNDAFTFYINVGNFTNAKAPVAPASYSGTNYLPTWHYAGVIGRTFRVGASFKFK
ncbi:TonB-dependent receptor domain-containing protein [Sphingomonas bacterium]|uniref:TonB-dependent receptor domain-containing protein n=1 Tax=Sphingomonas bacterium TaxID=1895847 RepID=UPI0015751A12|nr:TonB-dependent receptor [Sphingomonas bacterium]